MPTTVPNPAYLAGAHSAAPGVYRRPAAVQFGDGLLLAAWAVMLVLIAATTPAGPEPAATDPFQMMAAF